MTASSQGAPATRLEVRDLSAGYGRHRVLFGVSAQFFPASLTAIIGPNGAGKSTFLKAIFGLATVYQGQVLVDGLVIPPKAPELVRHGVAYVPQTANVFPTLSVQENLEIGTYVRAGRSGIKRVLELFPDLASVLRTSARKLSGGQRNMLAVGRALMSDPQILLVDEASGGLAPMVSRNLWLHLRKLSASGVTVVAVEQNVHQALEFSDDVYLFASGRNKLHETPKQLLARDDFEQMFLESKGTSGPAEQAQIKSGDGC